MANSTDGDLSTATGIGSGTRPGAFSTVGTFTFDMGSIQTVICGFKFGMSASAGKGIVHIQISDNNITFTRNDVIDGDISDNVEKIGYSIASIVNGRYIQILVQNGTGGATVSFRLFEVFAYKIPNP